MKKGRTEGLEVKKICGYIAVSPKDKALQRSHGWMYLRKHSSTQIFVGNLSAPRWITERFHNVNIIPQGIQKKLKPIISKMFPTSESIGDLFSIGNASLACRIDIRDGEKGLESLLKNPSDYIYPQFWTEFQNGPEEEQTRTVMERWVNDYEEARDEEKVIEWSNATMKTYELREKRKEEERIRREKEGDIPDEDGFVTVTSGAKQMKANEAVLKKTKGFYKSKSSKNRRNLLDVSKGIEKSGFYRWQRENENMLVDLQKKFRDDQKRVAAIARLETKSSK